MPSLFMLAFDIHRRAFTCMTFLQIGLMILYCSFIRSRSRALMMLTVIGRLRYYSPKPLNHDNIRVGTLPPPSLLLPQPGLGSASRPPLPLLTTFLGFLLC